MKSAAALLLLGTAAATASSGDDFPRNAAAVPSAFGGVSGLKLQNFNALVDHVVRMAKESGNGKESVNEASQSGRPASLEKSIRRSNFDAAFPLGLALEDCGGESSQKVWFNPNGCLPADGASIQFYCKDGVPRSKLYMGVTDCSGTAAIEQDEPTTCTDGQKYVCPDSVPSITGNDMEGKVTSYENDNCTGSTETVSFKSGVCDTALFGQSTDIFKGAMYSCGEDEVTLAGYTTAKCEDEPMIVSQLATSKIGKCDNGVEFLEYSCSSAAATSAGPAVVFIASTLALVYQRLG